ncbi:ArgE/DapE family deacylase [Cryobacterium melibiosiphilum]|uniref:Probable succinyl-diaminopimelate desuccinylase n=1 Tax=Cryobacterium melibiosiphilum TaxID=995039 RepID=A0A3A5MJ69_9MICO|nr:ArgE/DapE family deacylase [Cryobacterium melibiosiphilum]RJT89085.1 ArgE/DapE family deacylase [Cryobacterium melibiosiphilum]
MSPDLISPEPATPDLLDVLDPIDLLRTLIAIDSVNPDLVPGAAGEARIATWCAEWLAERGFEVHRLEERPGRPSIVGVFRGTGAGRSLMLNGHLDTVGVATYTGDPFTAEERDGRIFGRGSFDMLGGVAAILVAAARASASGPDGARLAGDVIVTLVADEEFGSLGTEEVLRHFRADAAIIAEPSGLELTLAHRGFAWFELELEGVAAHGSQPERGVDAIQHAALVFTALDGLRDRLESTAPHPTLGHGTVRVSMISGGDDAATVAAACTLTLERRMLPGEPPEHVEAELRELLDALAATVPDFAYRLDRLVARAAFEADVAWPIVEALQSSATRVLGRAPAHRGEPFWTDAGLILEAGIPCLVFGVDGGGAHADEEWAEVASVRQLAATLEGTLRDFCS